MENLLTISNVILDSLSDGVYVCDRNRKIVYWSRSAERVTGWQSSDVVGRRCLEDVLCHVDKDGHRLCGEEFCPLHRAMVTGTTSTVPLIVFAQGKDGQRIPMQVTVAPIRDAAGEVIGGVETFRDVSATLADLERAKRIQALSMQQSIPEDPRIRLSVFYTPHDIVGGDYCAVGQLNQDEYGFLIADVMGHGVAAALHTMHLSSLWTRYSQLLTDPVKFAAAVNDELSRVVQDESFATGVCGVIDARNKLMRFVGAGGPPILVYHADGQVEHLESSGLPFGILEDAPYEIISSELAESDRLLLFSDGAFEIHNAEGEMLGVEGLIRILETLGYPGSGIQANLLEQELLRYSNDIRLTDDVTFIEVQVK